VGDDDAGDPWQRLAASGVRAKSSDLATECTPPKVQFVPYIPMLQENNVRTGFVETEARMRLEQACGAIGSWMLAMFEVGCTYGWRHGSLLKMRVKQVDPHANVIRLEPGTTKNKKGLEVTMPRRVRELLVECIKGKEPEECLFTRANGTPVRDFRRSWRKACAEAGVPGLHFHDLRRTAARNMRRGHISERVAMEIGGWKTTSVFHRYAIVDNQDVARAMDMLETSQDQQRQELEQALAAKRGQPKVINDRNPSGKGQAAEEANLAANFSRTSRLRHVERLEGASKQIRRATKHSAKALHNNKLSGAGRGT
jgi:Phage integrase family